MGLSRNYPRLLVSHGMGWESLRLICMKLTCTVGNAIEIHSLWHPPRQAYPLSQKFQRHLGPCPSHPYPCCQPGPRPHEHVFLKGSQGLRGREFQWFSHSPSTRAHQHHIRTPWQMTQTAKKQRKWKVFVMTFVLEVPFFNNFWVPKQMQKGTNNTVHLKGPQPFLEGLWMWSKAHRSTQIKPTPYVDHTWQASWRWPASWSSRCGPLDETKNYPACVCYLHFSWNCVGHFWTCSQKSLCNPIPFSCPLLSRSHQWPQSSCVWWWRWESPPSPRRLPSVKHLKTLKGMEVTSAILY